tara:strand:- start:96 stop:767 length:672 start_codon:yes stop_codon:yes gene_type:complete
MNKNKICVFDFETDGVDIDSLNPVQLAAVIIDPRKLEVIDGAEFSSFIRPADFDSASYFSDHKSTIEWHARVRNCTVEEVLDLWKNAPAQDTVWVSFLEFLKRFHAPGKRKSKFTAPVSCGMNILGFDLPIVNRLNAKHNGGKEIFHPRDKIDLMHWFFPWFENNEEVNSFSMDNMREYFGMSTANAHDAIKDVTDTAELCIRFLKLYRKISKTVSFKGAFGK